MPLSLRLAFGAAAAALAAVVPLAAAAATEVFPIHGVVVRQPDPREIVLRVPRVPLELSGGVHRFRLPVPQPIPPGTGIDAFVVPPNELLDVHPAGPYVPGLPQPGRVVALRVGDRLPAETMVDETGRLVRLNSYAGRTVIVGFIYTRCTDECPIISGKFARLQRLLDPARFHLIEITIDPNYDSPRVLAAYARRFGADPAEWSLLTDEPSRLALLLDRFDVSSLEVGGENDAQIEHDNPLYIVAPDGRIADQIANGDWAPSDVAAEARSIDGMASNPLERLRLSLIADAVALCGGNQFVGIVLLELTLFAIIFVIALTAMWWVVRVLWGSGE